MAETTLEAANQRIAELAQKVLDLLDEKRRAYEVGYNEGYRDGQDDAYRDGYDGHLDTVITNKIYH